MDIKLHKQAATTPKIRAESRQPPASRIVSWPANMASPSRPFGAVGAVTMLHDRSHTQHNLLTTLTTEQEEVLIAAREFLRLGLDNLL